MQTLKNWTLDHENPDGITLSVEDRHLLHIIVLEDDIWRMLCGVVNEKRIVR